MTNRIDIYCNNDYIIQQAYTDHSVSYKGDSGLNILFIHQDTIPANSTTLIDLGVTVKCYKNGKPVSFFLLPRSSIYKTPLRLANSIGLIDSGFNGTLKAPLDNISNEDYIIRNGESIFQIVFPDLCHNFVVNTIKGNHIPDKTDDIQNIRNGKEFGSSNKI
jgi:dUTP pyrophosphatase